MGDDKNQNTEIYCEEDLVTPDGLLVGKKIVHVKGKHMIETKKTFDQVWGKRK